MMRCGRSPAQPRPALDCSMRRKLHSKGPWLAASEADSFGDTMKRILITLFSIGWLAPMWLATSTYLGFWRGDGWTLLCGRKDVGSFPVIQLSQQCLAVGVIWLAAVLAFWSWKLSGPGGLKQ